jgi:membrane protease YdiL (CAAX protease family)
MEEQEFAHTEPTHPSAETRRGRPFASLLVLAVMALIGLFVANFVGLVAVAVLLGFDIAEVQAFMLDPTGKEEYRMSLLVMQGIIAVSAFGLLPYIFASKIDERLFGERLVLSPNKQPAPGLFLLTLLIVFTMMPAMAWVVKWNNGWQLPEQFAAFEAWAKGMEENARQLTLFIVKFGSLGEFLTGLCVIALIPGLFEEYLFRGLIQPKVQRIFGNNVHVGIWLTALLFSAFHFQFYGLVPRMLLGALFGYMYVWSGNLALPILAHFTNNAFAIVVSYYSGQSILDAENNEDMLELAPTLGLLALAVAFLTAFYKTAKKKSPHERLDEGVQHTD